MRISATYNNPISKLTLALLSLWIIQGCSLKKITVDQTAAVLADSGRAFDTENDLELAAISIPASLKTVEGFLQAHPEQPILLHMLAQSYMSYAFGFIEDEAEELEYDDPDESEHLQARARNFYLRAKAYGVRLLALEHPELAKAVEQGKAPSEEMMADLDLDDLPAIFWTVNPWLGYVNLSKDKPSVLSQLPVARKLLEWCAEINPGYFDGSALMALGALEAGVPKALGGRPDEATKFFERGNALNDGKHLMTLVMWGRSVGIQTGDKKLYVEKLQAVIDADPDANPNLALANRLAQRRARRYLEQADDLFLD